MKESHDGIPQEIERFDTALTAYLERRQPLTGKVDQEMALAIEEIIGWADQSGVRKRPTRIKTDRMTPATIWFSVAAICVMVLTGVVGWRYSQNGVSNEQPTPPVLQAASGGDGENPVAQDGYVIPPLSAAECSAEPMSQSEAIGILQDVPKDGESQWASELPAEQSTIDEVNAMLRSWEVCNQTGKLYSAFQYETGAFMRYNIIGGAYMGWGDQPLSTPTLTELLNTWQSNMQWRIDQTGGPELFAVWMIDQSQPVMIAKNGTSIDAWLMEVDPRDGSREDGNPSVRISLQLVDGHWKIFSIDRNFSPR